MKKAISCLLVSAMLGATAFSMAACDNGGMLTTKPNVGVPAGASESVKSYDQYAYYELEDPSDVKFAFETTGSIQKVTYKYRSVSYSLKNDVITIDQDEFADETAGEKRIRVFVDDQYVEIKLRVVTKVIYTTEDFNTIRTNMNGVYVLGDDIDFGNESFWPIGKAVEPNSKGEYSDTSFEGIFDGMGYAVKNITIEGYDCAGPSDEYQNGPSVGPEINNGRNYNVGIFATTSANAEIRNTNFTNITVHCQGLGGAIVGANGGLIKNCRVSCTLNWHGEAEKAGGIAGINAGGDTNGRIENCIVVYDQGQGNGRPRGIADWNTGSISNCYAAPVNNYVLYLGWDYDTGKRPDDFNYTDYFAENASDWGAWAWNSWFTIPAFPGSIDTSKNLYYAGGSIVNSDVVVKEFLLNPENFPEKDGWDYSVWHFEYGMYPTLRIQKR